MQWRFHFFRMANMAPMAPNVKKYRERAPSFIKSFVYIFKILPRAEIQF